MNYSLVAGAVAIAVSASVNANQPTYSSNDELLNVHNRCIVQLDSNTDPGQVTGIAKSLAARGGASLQHVYKNSIKGFAINMPCSAATVAFGADARVSSLRPDGVVSISMGPPGGGGGGGQQVSYGTTRVGGPEDGTGYTAWIIDTGIDLDHPDLNVDSTRGFTAITKGGGGMDDQNGHGTHVAGTVGALDNDIGSLGVAPNTTVIPVRVLDRRGSGTYSGVIAGVDHVGANASPGDCANMSLGGGASQDVDDAVVAASENSGAFFVIAAGNDGDDANNYSPARANGNNVWTISAIDSNDNMPSWSNWGNPPIDYAAPGVSIFSLWKDGGTNTISGTSMASPHACAVIMLRNGNPSTDGTAGNDPDGDPDPIVHL